MVTDNAHMWVTARPLLLYCQQLKNVALTNVTIKKTQLYVVLTGSETEQWLGCKRSSETGAGQHHGHDTILLGVVVLLPTLCRPHFLEAGLHFLQDFGSVSYYQLHCSLSGLEQLHGLLVVLSFHTLKGKRLLITIWFKENSQCDSQVAILDLTFSVVITQTGHMGAVKEMMPPSRRLSRKVLGGGGNHPFSLTKLFKQSSTDWWEHCH